MVQFVQGFNILCVTWHQSQRNMVLLDLQLRNFRQWLFQIYMLSRFTSLNKIIHRYQPLHNSVIFWLPWTVRAFSSLFLSLHFVSAMRLNISAGTSSELVVCLAVGFQNPVFYSLSDRNPFSGAWFVNSFGGFGELRVNGVRVNLKRRQGRYMRVWSLTVWRSGSIRVWKSKSLKVWESECLKVWESECLGVW